MPDIGLPPGVTQESGMLLANGQITTDASTDATARERFNLGPGEFAVGIWGANYRWNIQAAVTEATSFISLNPDALTGVASVGSQAFGQRSEAPAATDLHDLGLPAPYNVMLPIPLLTVQDIIVICSTAGATGVLEYELYYAIYKVSSTVFTRIAGIVLSRG